MMRYVKHLWLAVVLIAVASCILLVSDLERRESRSGNDDRLPSIAVLQFSSTPLLDEHVAGVIDGLRKDGFLAEDNRNLHLFNPQGDFGTANAVAREMVKGPYDILVTSSTMALQIVANANKNVRKTHVFGAVTFPQGAGVGITGPAPDQHPPYMAGVGTFQPVKQAFRIARDMNPELRRVGVVWNPGEQCSEACLVEARAICSELGVELVEANATSTSEVSEAMHSLLAKNVEAIWIGGDTVANASATMIINLAKQAGIPVFTNAPQDADDGALFGLGASYYTVGETTASMIVAILKGRSPASYRIDNVVPEKFRVNDRVLAELAASWRMTPAALKLAGQSKTQPRELKPEPGRHYRIGLCYYVPAPLFEQAIAGFRKGLKEHGFDEGNNLDLIVKHANGEMSMLPQITEALLRENPGVLVPFSTPCLGSVIAHADGRNIAFGLVSAPLRAGAGKSFDDHLPNVTGIVQTLPTEELFDWTRILFPEVKRIGVLYNPSEANSIKELEDLRRIFKPRKLELEVVTVSNSSEVPENIQGLLSRHVDMVFLMADNTVANGMPAIIRACEKENIPVLADDRSLMGVGAIMSCAPGPYSDGVQTAKLVIRVLLGESPLQIPITPSLYNELTLDLKAAKENGIKLPVELLQRADYFFNVNARHDRSARIALINLVNNVSLDQAVQGVEAGLREHGLIPGQDYKITRHNAQGDMSQIPQIIEAAVGEHPDLIITVTTPVLIAAANKIFDIPLVFTVASNPEKLNLFTKGRPDNICGVYDDPPVEALLDMALQHNPALYTVGTLYDASQMNAVISVDKLRLAVEKHGLHLLETTVTSVSELPAATQSLIERGAEAILVSADNLINTGFPAIQKQAVSAGIPVFVTEPRLVKLGATGAIGDDYAAWGRQAGAMAAGILAGIPPVCQPIEPTRDTITIEPDTIREEKISQPTGKSAPSQPPESSRKSGS